MIGLSNPAYLQGVLYAQQTLLVSLLVGEASQSPDPKMHLQNQIDYLLTEIPKRDSFNSLDQVGQDAAINLFQGIYETAIFNAETRRTD